MDERQDLKIPPEFVRATIAREGESGRAWLDRLPGIIGALLAKWDLRRDGDLLHGYTAIVVPVRREDLSLMLKVRWLDDSTRQEARALRIWNGRGAVRLIDEEIATGALLLERLDPHRSLLTAPAHEAVEVAAGLLRRLAIPAPGDVTPISDETAAMIDVLPERWELAGGPFPRPRLDRVLELAAELGRTDSRHFVNYDLHYENVLAGTREPWLAIDPKVVSGDLEYAVAQLLWNRADEFDTPHDLEARLETIADVAGLDVERARLWSVVRLVETFVWAGSVGEEVQVATCRRLLKWLGWGRM